MRIRPATLADADAIAHVRVDTWRAAYAGIVPANYLAAMSYERGADAWRQRLAARGDHLACFVAEDAAGNVAGFAAGGPARGAEGERAPYDGELYAIYLRRSAQGRGLGRALLVAVAGALRQTGRRGMLVWVLAANLPARGFYEALGGRLIGEQTVRIGEADLPEVAYGWPDLDVLLAPQAPGP